MIFVSYKIWEGNPQPGQYQAPPGQYQAPPGQQDSSDESGGQVYVVHQQQAQYAQAAPQYAYNQAGQQGGGKFHCHWLIPFQYAAQYTDAEQTFCRSMVSKES